MDGGSIFYYGIILDRWAFEIPVGLNKWIMRPLKESLALSGSALYVARSAVGFDLSSVSNKRLPSFDLNFV